MNFDEAQEFRNRLTDVSRDELVERKRILDARLKEYNDSLTQVYEALEGLNQDGLDRIRTQFNTYTSEVRQELATIAHQINIILELLGLRD